MMARDLRPGDVIGRPGDELALVVSQQTPAGSVAKPEAFTLCEPGLVILSHMHDDFWVQTHRFTYACFKLTAKVPMANDVRVQMPARTGKFLNHEERLELLR